MTLHPDIEEKVLNEFFKNDRPVAMLAIQRLEELDFRDELDRQIVNHGLELDRKTFFGSIDDMIKQLQALKGRGYTSISEEWFGYEDNAFYADKFEPETDDEYVRRLYEKVDKEARSIKEETRQKIKAKAKIDKLLKEVKELKEKYGD